MARARTRWSAGSLVTTAIAVVGLAIIGMGSLSSVPGLPLVMFVIGAGWIVFFSLANAQVQTLSPDWIRARIIAVFMLLTEGGLAIGSLVWGAIGSRASVHAALVVAGTATMASTALAFIAPWPERTPDVTPWVHWRRPTVHDGAMATPDQGPVLVTVEYTVAPADVEEFLRAMQPYGRVRRRDGAFRWSVFRDVEQPDMYVEAFLVHSWAEHLRQHERLTLADRDLARHIATLTRGEPTIRHWIHPEIGDAGDPSAHTER